MKTLKIVFIVIATLIIASAAAFFTLNYFRSKPAGILISTTPQANVYVNGIYEGKTPFQKTYDPGEIDLKLVPGITDQNLFPFETKITLASGIQTIVRREFGDSDDTSSGDIISFEKEGGSDASLIVISTPDNAQVSVDGIPRGFAPYKVSSISPANHQITIKADGYSDYVMTVATKEGYRLTLFAKLAKSANSSIQSPTPSPTPMPSNFVIISDTPTGYLRVRTEPGTKGDEIGQVKPGEKYLYLGTDPDTGWLKIQFEEPQAGLPNGIVGWVSGQYAKVVDASGKTVTISPNQTPLPTASPL